MQEILVNFNANTIPKDTPEQEARFAQEMAKQDSEIDTSDIPPWTQEQFKNAIRGKFYRPVKAQITAMVDQDVLTWLKSQGRGYQTRLNAILRREMLASLDAASSQYSK